MSGKTYIFYGEDEPSASEALGVLKASLGPPEEVLPNTATLEGKTLAFGQLEMACMTIPFMAGCRLVVVQGFLERFDERQPGRAPRRAAAQAPKEDEWAPLVPLVKAIPPTTVLVFLSATVSPRNPMLVALREVTEVRAFLPLQGPQLEAWIQERVSKNRGRITVGAVRLLSTFVADDLRRMDNEVRKLCTYAGAETVDETMVSALVIDAREAGIFGMVDALMAGKVQQALVMMRSLLAQEMAGPYITTMLARQSRMLIIARSMRDSGAPRDGLRDALSTTSEGVAQRVAEQSRSYSIEQLTRLHSRILEADISMKDGSSNEDLALELLVMDATAILGRPEVRR